MVAANLRNQGTTALIKSLGTGFRQADDYGFLHENTFLSKFNKPYE